MKIVGPRCPKCNVVGTARPKVKGSPVDRYDCSACGTHWDLWPQGKDRQGQDKPRVLVGFGVGSGR